MNASNSSLRVLSLLLLIAAISFAQDRQVDVGSTRVEFVGRSGQLRLCKLDDDGANSTSCQGRFVQLKMDRLREIDSSGQQTSNKVSAFASQDFTWSEPVETNVTGNDTDTVVGTLVSFSSPVHVGGNGPNAPTANFTMTTITYHENGTTQNGNDTIFVPEGALKFTIEIDNWPFLDSDNSLEFGVDVRVGGNNTLLQRGNGTQAESNNLRFDFADGLSIDVPTTAVIDGVQTNMSATLESTADGYSLDWGFPSFNDSLFYDPVVSENLGSDESGNNNEPTASPTLSDSPSSNPTSAPSNESGNSAASVDDDEDDEETDDKNNDSGGRGINAFPQISVLLAILSFSAFTAM